MANPTLSFLSLILLAIPVTGFARVSPLFLPGETPPDADARLAAEIWTSATFTEDNPYALRRPLAEINFLELPEWKSLREVQTAFEYVRDQRLHNIPGGPFPRRRSFWLYPDDGCSYRSIDIAIGLELFGRPNSTRSLFIFGGTIFGAPEWRNPAFQGGLPWRYHVAQALRVGRQVYVLDPTLSLYHPVPFEDWLNTLVMHPKAAHATLCSPFAGEPETKCLTASRDDFKKIEYERNILELMDQEWNNLSDRELDPVAVLGDQPPWVTEPEPGPKNDTPWTRVPLHIETPHPFTPEDSGNWKIEEPRAEWIRVHFVKFQMDWFYAHLRLIPESHPYRDELMGWTRVRTDFYSRAFRTSQLELLFTNGTMTSDRWGFQIDYYEYVPKASNL